ncbi:CinA family protein, partial [Clostridium perfringens]|uniref:CinA family protein n=1 Tax=Clostridium perfringens TaxID=1502 RepID=UPI0018E3FE11
VGEALLSLGVELGYCARPGEVDLRVIGSPEQLAAAERIVQENLDPHIVSADGRALEKVVVDLLAERGAKLATAESCTGGFLAHRVTN